MADVVITPAPLTARISPKGFASIAREFLQCTQAYKRDTPSIAHFYLHCVASELAIKALLLKADPDLKVEMLPKKYKHDLMKAYDSLPPQHKTLTSPEIDNLTKANRIYKDKSNTGGFVYFSPRLALEGILGRGRSDHPDYSVLAQAAEKLVQQAVAGTSL
jgi:hypothetical protein